jgi:4-hydroxythreonine-4-phosphate dehydrogenase
MDKPKIGISIGDINGIGLEVVLKTFAQSKIFDQCTPVLYGNTKVVSYHKNIIEGDVALQSMRTAERLNSHKLNVVNVWEDVVNITLGKATDVGGKQAILSLERAVQDLQAGHIDALVTAPINKEAMKLADFPFPGHTEYLARELGRGETLMMMVHDTLRVGLVTNHVPIGEVADHITKKKIIGKLKVFEESLRMDFGLERPLIAVLGLNPHAGDGGVIGKEDEEIVRPAIVELKKSGMLVHGPFPADGFFGAGQFSKFDGVLAMYHDQGLVPFKTLAFGGGVNFTAGLTHVRTSPDHGTAYDIAGENKADPGSFRQALYLAIDTYRQRSSHLDMHSNILKKRELDQEEDTNAKDLPE